jgi:hypothetical protein
VYYQRTFSLVHQQKHHQKQTKKLEAPVILEPNDFADTDSKAVKYNKWKA